VTEVGELSRRLSLEQNADGGWGYNTAQSWTEPTALALLALEAVGTSDAAVERGINWLRTRQRPDGGWPPTPSVDTSTWVTTLALLAAFDRLTAVQRSSALLWIRNSVNAPPGAVEATVLRVLGLTTAKQPGGVPWFPGTAGWVIPTALSLISLSYAKRESPDPALSAATTANTDFHLQHRCSDGGWNHGGSKYRSENAIPIPRQRVWRCSRLMTCAALN
jgi:hypothetical protein